MIVQLNADDTADDDDGGGGDDDESDDDDRSVDPPPPPLASDACVGHLIHAQPALLTTLLTTTLHKYKYKYKHSSPPLCSSFCAAMHFARIPAGAAALLFAIL